MNPHNSRPDPHRLTSGFHFRGKLPHIKYEGRTYFTTFRLADSLPKEAVATLQQEREKLLQNALAGNRPLTWEEERQLFVWYSERVESYLDAGMGECWLRQPKMADLVASAVNFFNGERYDLRTWVVMPNHVHVVVWPYQGHSLSDILHSWKSYSANKINGMLNRTGQHFWQRESFDHWIRDDEERARLCTYVLNNPVKAGLCARPEDWRWSSASPRAAQFKPAQVAARCQPPVPPPGEDWCI